MERDAQADAAPRVSLTPPVLGPGILFALGALVVSSLVGTAMAPYLAVHYPLVLVALAPLPRHLILVAPHTPIVPFVLVATLRGLLSCIVAFEVGLRYGPQGVRMFERKSPRIGGFLRYFEQVFARAAPLFLLIAPGPMTSSLSGISGISRLVTWSISAAGLSLWACVNYQLGDWLQPWTGPLLAFFQRHLLEATLGCIALVAGYQWLSRRRRLRQLT